MKNFLALFGIILGLAAGSPAFAIQQLTYMPAVTNLADRLDEAAANVQKQAQTDAQRFDPAERDMLRALRRFAASADRFHAMVASYSSENERLESELDHMNQIAARIDDAVYRGHATRHATREWAYATALLRDVNRYFDTGSAGWEYP
jgi:uncharacterized protein YukE